MFLYYFNSNYIYSIYVIVTYTTILVVIKKKRPSTYMKLTYMLKKDSAVIRGKFDLTEKEYLTKIAKVVIALYFDKSLSARELEFFVICLIGLKRGHTNPNNGEFFKLFEIHYFDEFQTSAQKASLLCTQRKKLVTKDFLKYDKNTSILSVTDAWNKDSTSTHININLSINDK